MWHSSAKMDKPEKRTGAGKLLLWKRGKTLQQSTHKRGSYVHSRSPRRAKGTFWGCTPHKEICSRARWKDETKGQEVVVQKALDGTYTLCLTLFVFFISISYVCIFLPTEERVVTERRKSQCMNVMGTETSNGVTFQLRAFHSSPSEDSPVLCCQDGWMDYIMIVW